MGPLLWKYFITNKPLHILGFSMNITNLHDTVDHTPQFGRRQSVNSWPDFAKTKDIGTASLPRKLITDKIIFFLRKELVNYFVILFVVFVLFYVVTFDFYKSFSKLCFGKHCVTGYEIVHRQHKWYWEKFSFLCTKFVWQN